MGNGEPLVCLPYISQRNLRHHQVQVANQGEEENLTLGAGLRGGGRRPGRVRGSEVHAHRKERGGGRGAAGGLR